MLLNHPDRGELQPDVNVLYFNAMLFLGSLFYMQPYCNNIILKLVETQYLLLYHHRQNLKGFIGVTFGWLVSLCEKVCGMNC